MNIEACSWWITTVVLVALNVASLLVSRPQEHQPTAVDHRETLVPFVQAQGMWSVALGISLTTGMRGVTLKFSF